MSLIGNSYYIGILPINDTLSNSEKWGFTNNLVQIVAFMIDSNGDEKEILNTDIVYDNNGLGINSDFNSGGPQQQLNYYPTISKSEKIIIYINQPCKDLQISLSRIFPQEDQGEYAQILFYDKNNNILNEIVTTANQPNYIFQQDLIFTQDVKKIEIKALPYGGLSSQISQTNSSDFFFKHLILNFETINSLPTSIINPSNCNELFYRDDLKFVFYKYVDPNLTLNEYINFQHPISYQWKGSFVKNDGTSSTLEYSNLTYTNGLGIGLSNNVDGSINYYENFENSDFVEIDFLNKTFNYFKIALSNFGFFNGQYKRCRIELYDLNNQIINYFILTTNDNQNIQEFEYTLTIPFKKLIVRSRRSNFYIYGFQIKNAKLGNKVKCISLFKSLKIEDESLLNLNKAVSLNMLTNFYNNILENFIFKRLFSSSFVHVDLLSDNLNNQNFIEDVNGEDDIQLLNNNQTLVDSVNTVENFLILYVGNTLPRKNGLYLVKNDNIAHRYYENSVKVYLENIMIFFIRTGLIHGGKIFYLKNVQPKNFLFDSNLNFQFEEFISSKKFYLKDNNKIKKGFLRIILNITQSREYILQNEFDNLIHNLIQFKNESNFDFTLDFTQSNYTFIYQNIQYSKVIIKPQRFLLLRSSTDLDIENKLLIEVVGSSIENTFEIIEENYQVVCKCVNVDYNDVNQVSRRFVVVPPGTVILGPNEPTNWDGVSVIPNDDGFWPNSDLCYPDKNGRYPNSDGIYPDENGVYPTALNNSELYMFPLRKNGQIYYPNNQKLYPNNGNYSDLLIYPSQFNCFYQNYNELSFLIDDSYFTANNAGDLLSLYTPFYQNLGSQIKSPFVMCQGNCIKSSNSRYYFIINYAGVCFTYDSQNDVVLNDTSNLHRQRNNNSSRLRQFLHFREDSNLIFYNVRKQKFTLRSTIDNNSPHTLKIENNGLLNLYDKNNILLQTIL